jgi:hypothetical protein
MGIGYKTVLNRGISHVTAIPVDALGDRVLLDGNEYAYAYNGGTLTAQVGYGMANSSQTGYTVIASHVTGKGSPVGVVTHNDIPSGEYGWIMVRGHAPIVAGLNTSLDANDALIMVATTNTGNISRKTLNSVASNEAFLFSGFGVVVVATGTAGVAKAKINCF